MAAYVCATCETRFPPEGRFTKCPSCGTSTRYSITESFQSDWEELVGRAEASKVVTTEEERVTNWRLLRLLNAGLDYDTSVTLAADHSVDIMEFRRLVSRGATPQQAARILG